MMNLNQIKLILIVVVVSVMTQNISAQTIKGYVIDIETRDPVPGATVLEIGTDNGVATGFNGEFTLNIENADSKIEISFLGYETYVLSESEIKKGQESSGITIGISPDGLTLKDVVVTANRVEENLQKVNVSATVVGRKDLEERTVNTSVEALTAVPNVITDSYGPSLTNISIRGLSTNFDGVGLEQAVGMYINDVYQSRAYGFNSLIMDVERIEVLRGPQGTLFGKNTVGGVVNIISAQPGMFNSGAVEVSGGNFDFFSAKAMANIELSKDKVALRISGAYNQRHGSFVKHIDPEIDKVNETKFYGLRASLLVKPSDHVDITFEGYYAKDNSAEASFSYLSSEDLQAFDPILFAPDDYENREASFSEPFTFERSQFGLSGKVVADIGNNTLTSITAYSSSEDQSIQDVEASAIPAVYLDRSQEFGTFSQEIRLNSPRDLKLNYVTGLYYVNENIKGNDIGVTQEFLPPLLGPDLGVDDLFIPGYTESVSNNSSISNNSFAAFGSLGYKFTDRLSLNVGLRFTSESKTFKTLQETVESQDAIDAVGFPIVWLLGTPYEQKTFDNTDNIFTGDIGLSYQVNEKNLLYGKFSRGFKGTGYNFAVSTYLETDSFEPTEDNVLYKPEFINSFEIGFKSSLTTKIRLNVAAYYIDYKDKQELLFAGLTNVIANAEKSSGYGGELEFSAILAKGFQIDVNGGVQQMKYDEFLFGDIDLSGNELSKAPGYTFSISPQYGTTFDNGSRLSMRVDFNHSAKSYNDIFNTETISRKAVTLINARVGYSLKDGRYNIGLWGKNLSDQVYFGHGFQGLIGDFVSLNQARTMGLDFRANFF
ncbi:TonB-dependent receptor [Lutimonas saemankumensis]|uniref:TonB-dependent receptor n=1 Tax=Lutimonas saemankumensis TaxID=483016 RepID=UPI001CD3430E|nr:TonB-dependent receptor [Lutimonas saemankumensis]MCA0933649.1 TonB-dependent receptor [Lutimonas saemankumensis]